jgi:hypothetical protein
MITPRAQHCVVADAPLSRKKQMLALVSRRAQKSAQSELKSIPVMGIAI